MNQPEEETTKLEEQITPEKTKCVMCGNDAEYIATETNEPLCENCTLINEGIKERDYPEKVEKFKFKPIENDALKE